MSLRGAAFALAAAFAAVPVHAHRGCTDTSIERGDVVTVDEHPYDCDPAYGE
jgi:hypothetical protein